jgi:hypothetical protein
MIWYDLSRIVSVSPERANLKSGLLKWLRVTMVSLIADPSPVWGERPHRETIKYIMAVMGHP